MGEVPMELDHAFGQCLLHPFNLTQLCKNRLDLVCDFMAMRNP